MLRIFIFVFLSLFLMNCNEEKKSKKISNSTSEKVLKLPALPQADFMKIYNQATYVDYIFYNLPFSLSQDNQASIHSNLNLLGKEQLKSMPEGCKPIGREFFQINGEVTYEADLYFSDGCYGYIFIKDGKPHYANTISPAGMKFYSKIINQANQVRSQATGQ